MSTVPVAEDAPRIPAPVDPATTPTLSGVLAPVADERDAESLPIVGELPADLRGAYLRNGPNPLFPPLGSYTFPLEGDAMLHGIWIDDDGSARYRNRFVWTPQLEVERDAGRARWAGIMTPYFPGPDLVPAELANNFKPSPFINVIHHGDRWLALSEVDPPWEITADLGTVGHEPFTWGDAIPGTCAHPRGGAPRGPGAGGPRAVPLGRRNPRHVRAPARRPRHGRDGDVPLRPDGTVPHVVRDRSRRRRRPSARGRPGRRLLHGPRLRPH